MFYTGEVSERLVQLLHIITYPFFVSNLKLTVKSQSFLILKHIMKHPILKLAHFFRHLVNIRCFFMQEDKYFVTLHSPICRELLFLPKQLSGTGCPLLTYNTSSQRRVLLFLLKT